MNNNYKNINAIFKYIELNEDFKDTINYHQTLLEEFDGYFTSVTIDFPILITMFVADNLITENKESYINVFIPSFKNYELDNLKLFKELEKYSEHLKENYNTKLVYVHIFYENKDNIKINEDMENIHNFNLVSSVIKKNLYSSRKTNDRQEYNIRLASKNDLSDILICLEEAYLNGTEKEQYAEIGEQKLKENIRNYYRDNLLENYLVLVAEKDRVFCGHITLDLEGKNNFIDGESINIVDVFVIEKFKGFGIEKMLTHNAERVCEKNGEYNLVGTMKTSKSSSSFYKKLSNLNNNEWETTSVIYNKIYK